jgi:hypothetical protein
MKEKHELESPSVTVTDDNRHSKNRQKTSTPVKF